MAKVVLSKCPETTAEQFYAVLYETTVYPSIVSPEQYRQNYIANIISNSNAKEQTSNHG